LPDKFKSIKYHVYLYTLPHNTYMTEIHSANYFIVWWSAVYSRLSYLNPQQFLGRYTEIFGDKLSLTPSIDGVGKTADDGSGGALPTTSILALMNKQATSTNIMGLLDDKTMLGLTNSTPNDKRWGLNVIQVDGINTATPAQPTLTLDCITNYENGVATDRFGEVSQVASWAAKVNIILGERRKMDEKQKPASMTPEMMNCAPKLDPIHNTQLVFRAISDSNYGTTYVFGDKRAPKMVWVVFRGTANAKSALAYTRPSSLTATEMVIFNKRIEKGLSGIFKILQEQIHIILQMAVDVAKELNPGVQLPPGSVCLMTTGHSLGGALATAFAGEYAQQISVNLSSIGAEMFRINIGCFSLASPRIFDKTEAEWFCCLTQASTLCKSDKNDAAKTAIDTVAIVKGRILFIRNVTKDDIVPGLPQIGYEHPCSTFKEGERDDITMDCDIEEGKIPPFIDGNAFITNKISTRCLNLTHKRPSMTAKISKAPACTTQRRTSVLSTLMYHLTYCGIMFAGGVDMSSALSLDVERLQAADVNDAADDPTALGIKADDTMMRILWYGVNQILVAKCVFFDLVPFRVKEVMAQGGGGIKQKGGLFGFGKSNKVAPAPNVPPASNVPAPASNVPAPASNVPAPASNVPAPASNVPAPASNVPAPGQDANSAVLFEDTLLTSTFVVDLKNAVVSNSKYDYDITNNDIPPPILYRKKPVTYDYLYKLPSNIKNIQKPHVLFFGTKPIQPQVRTVDANGNPVLTPEEQANLTRHNQQVTQELIADQRSRLDIAMAPVPTTVATQVVPTTVATQVVPTTVAPTTSIAPAPAAPTTSVAPAAPTTSVAPAPAAPTKSVAPAPAQGGRRTRRKSLPKTRKHRKGNKGNKCIRVSRRKHRKSHAKRR
jgi:Lipase (class 3)